MEKPSGRFPLGPRTPYNEVCTRVAVRLIQIDYRKNPQHYTYKPRGVARLADNLRAEGITSVWPYLISASKAVMSGMTLEQWRSWAILSSHDVLRSIHKRPFRPSR